MTFGGTLLRRRAPRKRSILADAVAYALASRYPGSGPLLDQSGRGHDAQLGSTSGADSNDPLFLPYAGEKYLYNPGNGSNGASTPHHASHAVTDLDFRVEAELADWTPGGVCFGGKDDSGANRDWQLSLENLDKLWLFWWESGGTLRTVESSVVPNISDGDRVWLRVTLDVDDGAGGHVVRFYTSTDYNPDAMTGTWDQVGTDRTAGAFTTSIRSLATPLAISNNSAPNKPLTAGKVYRAQLLDGIGGSVVADFDPSRSVEPHTTFVASTGETWTINRSSGGRKASLVDRDLFLFGTDDYMVIPDHADFDFAAGEEFTIVAAVRVYGSPSGVDGIIGNTSLGNRGWAIVREANRFYCYVVGDASKFPSVIEVDGASLVASRVEGGNVTAIDVTNGTESSTAMPAGTLAGASNLHIGALPGPTAFVDMELIGYAIFRRALIDEELTKLQTEFGL